MDIQIAPTIQETVGLSTAGTAFDGSSATVVDLANDTLLIGGSLVNGAAVIYRHSGGSDIGGLTQYTTYYVRNTSTPGRVQLFATKADALDTAGSPTPVPLTALGSGSSHRLDPRITVAGIAFTIPNNTGGTVTGTYNNFFRPDQGAPDPLNAVVYTDTTVSKPIAGAFDFDQLIASSNVIVKASSALVTDPRIDITAGTDVLGNGYLDFLSNGSIDITEFDGDARLQMVQSNTGDVSIASTTGAVYDIRAGAADNGLTPWVIGHSVDLRAAAGSAIGFLDDFLEINSSNQANGDVYALAGTDVYVKETAGDLRLDGITAQEGNVLLITVSGSLLDAEGDLEADIQGTDIDLLIAGGIGTPTNPVDLHGAGEGQKQNSLQLDDAVPGVGRLYVSATNGVNLQEVNATLNVLKVISTSGAVNLWVYDTALAGEDLVLLTSGATQLDPTTEIGPGRIECAATGEPVPGGRSVAAGDDTRHQRRQGVDPRRRAGDGRRAA